jgi:hypothetical protein
MHPRCKDALGFFLAVVCALVSCSTRALAVDLPKVICYELKVQLVPREEQMSAAVQKTTMALPPPCTKYRSCLTPCSWSKLLLTTLLLTTVRP